jgi:ABC-type lipoprotein export system ATPase subunit
MSELIQLRNIRKTYHLGEIDLEVLRGVSLQVAVGELMAVMGASGSGKSTLMNILGCLDHPTSGEYLLDGQEVSRFGPRESARMRNRMIGFVFQSFNLLPRTSAVDNVLMPLTYNRGRMTERQKRERAKEMIERVGLTDRMNHLPLTAFWRRAAAGRYREVSGQSSPRAVCGRADRKSRFAHQRGDSRDVREA